MRAATAATAVTFRALDDPLLELVRRDGRVAGAGRRLRDPGRGAALVRRVEGDYLNVVGLPVATLLDLWPDLLAAVMHASLQAVKPHWDAQAAQGPLR